MVKKTKNSPIVNENKNIKKKQNKSNTSNTGFFKRMFLYLKEVKSELKKVVWPTKSNFFNATLTVFNMVIIVSAIVMVADLTFSNMLKFLLNVV